MSHQNLLPLVGLFIMAFFLSSCDQMLFAPSYDQSDGDNSETYCVRRLDGIHSIKDRHLNKLARLTYYEHYPVPASKREPGARPKIYYFVASYHDCVYTDNFIIKALPRKYSKTVIIERATLDDYVKAYAGKYVFE